MEADLLLQAIEELLRLRVEAAGGVVAVADNPWDVEGLLKLSPAKWRVILSWEDEDAVEDQCRGGWTAGVLSVFVQTHRGLEAQPGLTIHRESPHGRTSVTRRVAQVRRWLRSIQFDEPDIAKDDFSHLIFLRAQWLEGAAEKEKPWRCRRLDFRVVYALDDPFLSPPPDEALTLDGISEDGGYYLLSRGGQPMGRMPRLLAGEEDPVTDGDVAGWRISGISEDGGYYLITYDGAPHGRTPAFMLE